MSTGCGLFADALSDATAQDIHTDVMPPTELGQPPVQPVSFAATASDASPTFSVPADLDMHDWGSIIAAHNAAIDAGDTEGVFELQVSNFAMSSTQNLRFTITVGSSDGRVFLMGGETGETPASCTFVVASGSNGSTLGSRIGACLSDWVRANGIPAQLTYDVNVAPTSQPGQQVSGLPFSVTHTEQLLAKRQLEQSCYERKMAIDSAILENLANIKISDLSVQGEAVASVAVSVHAWARVSGAPGTDLSTFVRVAGGMQADTPAYYRHDGKKELQNDLNAMFQPPMPKWMYDTFDAAIALAESNRANNTSLNGVVGCYTVYGAAPRTGTISFTVNGTAKYSTERN